MLYGKVKSILKGYTLQVGESSDSPYGYSEWGNIYAPLEECKRRWHENAARIGQELTILDGVSSGESSNTWGTQRSGMLD